MKKKTALGFNKKAELESFKGSLNDSGMKIPKKDLSRKEFTGELIRDHQERVGKLMKKKGMTADGAVERLAQQDKKK